MNTSTLPNQMTAIEEKNIPAAKTMARFSTEKVEPKFNGWYSAGGKWVGWYDGGKVVWLKDDLYAFEKP